MKNYHQRIADSLLNFKLHSKGAVLIEGPKWCGKTTTALQIAKSSILMQAKDNLKDYLYQRTKRNPMILPIIMEV